jgi:hypothetical protein
VIVVVGLIVFGVAFARCCSGSASRWWRLALGALVPGLDDGLDPLRVRTLSSPASRTSSSAASGASDD